MKLISRVIDILCEKQREEEIDLTNKVILEMLTKLKAKELETRVEECINKIKNGQESKKEQKQQSQTKPSKYSSFTQKVIDNSKRRSEEIGKEKIAKEGDSKQKNKKQKMVTLSRLVQGDIRDYT